MCFVGSSATEWWAVHLREGLCVAAVGCTACACVCSGTRCRSDCSNRLHGLPPAKSPRFTIVGTSSSSATDRRRPRAIPGSARTVLNPATESATQSATSPVTNGILSCGTPVRPPRDNLVTTSRRLRDAVGTPSQRLCARDGHPPDAAGLLWVSHWRGLRHAHR